MKRSFVEELETRAADVPEGGSVEEQWTAIKNAFIETSANNLGELRTQRKEWITDETWRKIEERREAKAAIERARTRAAKYESRQRYSALEKEVKRCCRRDKRAWVDSLADEGEKAAATGDIRLLYDISRRLSGARMNPKMPVKDATGQLLTDPPDQLKRWFEHFEQLLHVSTSNQPRDPPRVRRITRVNTEAPSCRR